MRVYGNKIKSFIFYQYFIKIKLKKETSFSDSILFINVSNNIWDQSTLW